MNITAIPLCKITLSDLNVRKTERDADIEALADDIAARGLKQNLVVIPSDDETFEVVAGGRRYQAMQLLVGRGAMTEDAPIPVLVEDADQGIETSLAENLHRVAMNPADELDAYRTIIDGATGSEADRVAYCAKRFGKTVRHVEQRLHLARLAPAVLEDLRAGGITLDVAKAFASTTDVTRQQAAYDVLKKRADMYRSSISTHEVRNMLTANTVSNADPRAILIGRTAYEAAGGTVQSDLFAAVGTERWGDVPLLEKLAAERMEELAEEARKEEGLAAVVPVLMTIVPYGLSEKLHGWTPPTEERVDADTQARIDALLTEQEAIAVRLGVEYDEDDEGRPIDEALGRDWDRFEAIAEELPDLYATAERRPVAMPPEKRARFTRFLTLQQDGTTKLSERWYCAEKIDADGEPVVQRTAPAPATSGMSEALSGELAMQRRDVLAVEIARDPYAALLYAQFAIVDRTVGRMRADYATYGTSLQANDNDRWEPVTAAYDPERGTAHIRDAEAWRSLLWIESELDWEWCGGLDKLAGAPRSKWADGQLERFDDFRALTEDARDALFAWAVARSLKASGGVARLDAVHDRLAEMLEIDVAKWWRPTRANYFNRITVDDIKADLEQMSGGVASTSGKKGELAARAEELAAGASGHSDHVNGLGSRWVPAAMRFRVLPASREAE